MSDANNWSDDTRNWTLRQMLDAIGVDLDERPVTFDVQPKAGRVYMAMWPDPYRIISFCVPAVPLDHAAGGRGDSGGMRPDPGADTATLDR